jgi:hypothetical protein
MCRESRRMIRVGCSRGALQDISARKAAEEI